MTTDIFERLREDHDEFRTLIDILEKTEGDSEGRLEIFPKLAWMVRTHAHAEERVLYAELMRYTETRELAGHSTKEHHEAEEIIEDLEGKSLSDSGWLTRFKTLAEELRHHMDEEEKEVFPVAGRVLSADRKRAMVDEFDRARRTEAEKAREETRLQPLS